MKIAQEHNTEHKNTFRAFKTCMRFNSLSTQPDEKDAIIYLKLRSNGCDIKSAKRFVTKKICMVDTTREYEGPIKSRTLKVKKNACAWITNVYRIHLDKFENIPFIRDGALLRMSMIWVVNTLPLLKAW